MIALLEAQRAGLLGRKHWLPNLISGLIVGVVALPLAMAFAIASGAKPEQGLYTSIVAGLLVSVLGGSRLQIAGPTGAFVVILAGVTAKHGIDGLQIATLMAGVILLFFGLARLGVVIKFIPAPVIVGFTAGIGIIIWVGQWKDFFGLPKPQGEHFHQQLWHLLQSLPQLHPATTTLALMSLAILIALPRFEGLKRVPGPLVALVFATVVQSIFHFNGVATIGSAFGGIPQGLPTLHWPEVTLTRVVDLIGPAFVIAMLGAIESLLSAVVADGMANTRHNPNQELIGQGIANVISPLFGGFAATGALARTATNVRNGGTGPLAGIVHSVMLMLMVLALAPLAANIPLAVLAAILFIVAWNMSDVRHFVRMLRRAPTADAVILLTTFVLTVFTDLVVAVNIGVLMALLQFLRRMASSVEVQPMSAEELRQELALHGIDALPPDVTAYVLDGPLFFGATEKLEHTLGAAHEASEVLILHLRWVPFVDVTGLQVLDEVIRGLKKRGVQVLLSGANPRVRAKLERAHIISLVGADCVFDAFPDAVQWCLAQRARTISAA